MSDFEINPVGTLKRLEELERLLDIPQVDAVVQELLKEHRPCNAPPSS